MADQDGAPRNPVQVVFDTDCILCSAWVRFLLRHEASRDMVFLSAWSAPGLQLAAQYGITREDLGKSYLVVADGRPRLRSDAGLRLVRELKWPWRALGILRLVPRPLRDLLYDLVARNRYRWFGREQDCLLPPPAERHRFILASDQLPARQERGVGPQ